jgi:hypothetical protein
MLFFSNKCSDSKILRFWKLFKFKKCSHWKIVKIKICSHSKIVQIQNMFTIENCSNSKYVHDWKLQIQK